MTVHADRKLELLKLIAANPGIDAGLLMSRSATCRRASEFDAAAKGLLNDDDLVDIDGSGPTIRYYLTERGAGAAAEYGFDVAAEAVPAGADQEPEEEVGGDFVTSSDSIFEELLTITAGAGEVVLEQESEPLPVIDSDRTSLDEALAQLREITTPLNKPKHAEDVISFLTSSAQIFKERDLLASMYMTEAANLIENAYSD